MSRKRPIAAIIVPAQHLLDGAGAYAVFRQEIDTVQDLGFESRLLVVAPRLNPRPAEGDWLARVEAAAWALRPAQMFISTRKRPILSSLLAHVMTGTAIATRTWAPAADLAVDGLVDPTPARTLFETEPDVVICNYLSGLSHAETIAPPSKHILVLHDASARPLPARLRARLERTHQILTLSPEDADTYRRQLGSERVSVGLPLAASHAFGFRDLLEYQHLGEVLDASEPETKPLAGWSSDQRWQAQRSLDLLFVGGSHAPNVDGLRRFVGGCFIPHLQKHGVRLVVAGPAGTMIWKREQTPDGIVALGRVRNLQALYAAAKLVIVPLVSGTGISIKTLEAISFGKPVLSTPVGMRGLGHLADEALHQPFDRRWADRILELLHSRQTRRELRNSSLSQRSSTLTQSLREAITDLCSDLEIPKPDSLPSSRGSWPLTEWPGPMANIVSHLREKGRFPDVVAAVTDLITHGGCLETRSYIHDLASDIAKDLLATNT